MSTNICTRTLVECVTSRLQSVAVNDDEMRDDGYRDRCDIHELRIGDAKNALCHVELIEKLVNSQESANNFTPCAYVQLLLQGLLHEMEQRDERANPTSDRVVAGLSYLSYVFIEELFADERIRNLVSDSELYTTSDLCVSLFSKHPAEWSLTTLEDVLRSFLLVQKNISVHRCVDYEFILNLLCCDLTVLHKPTMEAFKEILASVSNEEADGSSPNEEAEGTSQDRRSIRRATSCITRAVRHLSSISNTSVVNSLSQQWPGPSSDREVSRFFKSLHQIFALFDTSCRMQWINSLINNAKHSKGGTNSRTACEGLRFIGEVLARCDVANGLDLDLVEKASEALVQWSPKTSNTMLIGAYLECSSQTLSTFAYSINVRTSDTNRASRKLRFRGCYGRFLNFIETQLISSRNTNVQNVVDMAVGQTFEAAVSRRIFVFDLLCKLCCEMLQPLLLQVWSTYSSLVSFIFQSLESYFLEYVRDVGITAEELIEGVGTEQPLIQECLGQLGESNTGIDRLRSIRLAAFSIFQPLLNRIAEIARNCSEPSAAVVAKESHAVALYGRCEDIKSSIHQLLGMAMRVFGVDIVLTLRPLELRLTEVPLTEETYAYQSGSWILPILEASTCRARLGFFAEYFLPIVNRIKEMPETGDLLHLEMPLRKRLVTAVWQLLPRFCIEPVDGMQELTKYLSQLMNLLDAETEVREAATRGLAVVFTDMAAVCRGGEKCLNLPVASYVYRTVDEKLLQLSSSLMFKLMQLYEQFHAARTHDTSEGEVSRACQQLLMCAKAVSGVCSDHTTDTIISKVMVAIKKLAENHGSLPIDHKLYGKSPEYFTALLDFTDVLIGSLRDTPAIQAILTDLLALLKVTSDTKLHDVPQDRVAVSRVKAVMQRTYKLLKHFFECAIEEWPPKLTTFLFEPESIRDVWSVLRDARAGCSLSSRRNRIVCVHMFVEALAHAPNRWKEATQSQWKAVYTDILPTLVPEILVHMQEPNKASRTNGIAILKGLCESCCKDREMLTSLAVLIMAGLTGSAGGCKAKHTQMQTGENLMASGALLGLAILLKQSHTSLSEHDRDSIINIGILHLQKHNDSVLFRMALKFVKTVMGLIPKEAMVHVIGPIIDQMLENPLSKKKKATQRQIIERAVKTLGEKQLLSCTSVSATAFVKHVTKSTRKRKEKQRKRNVDTTTVSNDETSDLSTGECDSTSQEGEKESKLSKKGLIRVKPPEVKSPNPARKFVEVRWKTIQKSSDGAACKQRRRIVNVINKRKVRRK